VIRSLHNAFVLARFRRRELIGVAPNVRASVERGFLGLDTAFPLALAPSNKFAVYCVEKYP
jgi:hypothetical protein